ncbi:MAG TPA: hypothetical protein VNA30_05445 [Mycobacteriales bacterium]|nr:hypothetical protein [Mycobacteriales bacterium]
MEESGRATPEPSEDALARAAEEAATEPADEAPDKVTPGATSPGAATAIAPPSKPDGEVDTRG